MPVGQARIPMAQASGWKRIAQLEWTMAKGQREDEGEPGGEDTGEPVSQQDELCPWHDLVAPEGIFQIRVNGSRPVLCDGQGWMDILSRGDGSENFDRNWTDYKEGFGKLWGEFFLGLEKLHQLTKDEPHLLYVYLRDVHSNSRFARYDGFQIGSEEESYSLKALGRYSGSAGDSLGIHRGMKFSTIDRDNTRSKANCAEIYGGGWWYNDCGDR
nr:ficolin-1-like [Drosophila kikkawai]